MILHSDNNDANNDIQGTTNIENREDNINTKFIVKNDNRESDAKEESKQNADTSTIKERNSPNEGTIQGTIHVKSKKSKKTNNKYDYVQKSTNYGNVKEIVQTYEVFKSKYIPKINKDLPLKFLTKLLFNSMGYYCELEVNILTQSFNQQYKKEQISDIDVLGIRIENDLYMEYLPVECKSGEEGALDELLKLKGLMEYLNSYKGYLVKSKIANNAREMGEKINVSTLDQKEIRLLLNNLGLLSISDERWIEIQINNYLREKYIIEKATVFNRALEYIKNEYWQNKNFRNIHNLLFLVASQKDSNIYNTDEGKYTIIQLSKYLTISLLKLSSYIIQKNYSNPVDKVKEYLFGGAREKREREVLFDRVNQVLAGCSKPLQKFEPDYTEQIVELCIRLINAPNHAKHLPVCFDFCLNSLILKNDGYDRTKISDMFTSITLKLMKDILIFVCKQGNVKFDIFEDILSM